MEDTITISKSDLIAIKKQAIKEALLEAGVYPPDKEMLRKRILERESATLKQIADSQLWKVTTKQGVRALIEKNNIKTYREYGIIRVPKCEVERLMVNI